MVCISSINRITSPCSLSSFITDLSLSSNSPLYFAPATIPGRSSVTILLSLIISGTSPSTIFWARPSAMAVLPTPGSPMSTGLFFVLLLRTCMTLSISLVRPITGSISPFCAILLRSMLYFSRLVACFFSLFGVCCFAVASVILLVTSWASFAGSTPSLLSIAVAMPSPSAISPRRRCSVLT